MNISVTSNADATDFASAIGLPSDRQLAVAGAVALSVIVLAFAGGGVTSGAWPWLIAGFTLLAASLVLTGATRSDSNSALLFVSALLVLSLWTGLSTLWSIDSHASLRELERNVLYLAAFAAGYGFVRLGGEAAVVGGIALGATAVAGYSLVDFASRTRRDFDPLPSAPMGYANALAILCLLAAIASVSVATSARSARGRLLWLSLLTVLCPTIALTKSTGTAVVGALVLIAVVIPWIASTLSPRVRPPVLVAGILTACTLIAVGTSFGGSHLAHNDRVAYWRAAAKDLRSHALAGSGGGTYASYWSRHPEQAQLIPLEAHSLYLETGAELGSVGLAVMLATMAVPLVSVLRRGPILDLRRDPVRLGATCAYAAFVVHAAVDWDWEIPVVCVSGLYLAAVLLASGRDDESRREGVRSRAH